MITARKFRIYPTPEQEDTLLRWEDALRWYWNMNLEERLRALPRLRELRARLEHVDKEAHKEFYDDAEKQLKGFGGDPEDSDDPVQRAQDRLRTRGLLWSALSFMGQQATRTDMRALSKIPEYLEHMPDLAEMTASSQGLLLDELDKAWQEFVRRNRGIPKFKSVFRCEVSIGEGNGASIKILGCGDGGSIRFPKLDGDIRTIFHREIGTIKQGRIVRDGGWVHRDRMGKRTLRGHGEWYLAISVEIADLPKRVNDKVIALNLGGVNLVADSDGSIYPTPRFMSEHEEKRLIRLQQVAAEKQEKTKAIIKDLKQRARECAESDPKRSARLMAAAKARPIRSNRWNEVMDKAAEINRTAARRREHFIHNLSLYYANSFGTVIVHEMDLKNIMKKANDASLRERAAETKRNRVMANAGVGDFLLRLKYKVEQRGGKYIVIKSENISRTCYECGHCAPENIVDRGTLVCQKCGHMAHSDVNAAKNAKMLALDPDKHAAKKERKALKRPWKKPAVETAAAPA